MGEQLHTDIGQSTILQGGNKRSDCIDANSVWYASVSSGAVSSNNKHNNRFLVRPVSATPRVVYDIPFSSIIRAWLDCEQNKRAANSCTKFRWHAARDLVALWREMCAAKYDPHSSMCFMVTTPVLREVWAGAFRDRVVHHWEYLRFGPVIENYFVAVGDVSMNCRKGYGALRAVHTLDKMIYDFTEAYTRSDCWIVGGDFANFFMSIDKDLLWGFLEHIIMDEYDGADKSALLYMMRTTLYHRCSDNFYRKSPLAMWEKLPPRKSLFFMDGLPIGNLPSQIWANFVGAIFTDWLISHKKIAQFIIFVDDWRLLVRSPEEGRRLIAEIKDYLSTELHVTLHPNKIYLQHYSKGTKFVGSFIKPPCNKPTCVNHAKRLRKWLMRGINQGHIVVERFRRFLLANLGAPRLRRIGPGRVYVSNRTRGYFISTMIEFNNLARTHAERMKLLEKVRASINSYLGLMCHYNSYNVRRKICEQHILPVWGKYLYFVEGFTKCVIRREYDKLYVLRKRLKNHRYAAKFIRPKWSPN